MGINKTQIGIEIAQCFNLAHAEILQEHNQSLTHYKDFEQILIERTKELHQTLTKLKEETITKKEQESLVVPTKKVVEQDTIIPEKMLEEKK